METPFVLSYLGWHYRDGVTDLLRIWLNSLWFCAHFFSLREMVVTFFQPFQRLTEDKGSSFGFFQRFILNTLMRLVGMVARFGMLVVGSVFMIAVFVIGASFVALWLAWPLVIIAGIAFGMFQLLSALGITIA